MSDNVHPILAQTILTGEQGELIASWPSWPPLEQMIVCNEHINVYKIADRYALLTFNDRVPSLSRRVEIYKEEQDFFHNLLRHLQVGTVEALSDINKLDGKARKEAKSALAKSLDVFAMHLRKEGFAEENLEDVRKLAARMREKR